MGQTQPDRDGRSQGNAAEGVLGSVLGEQAFDTELHALHGKVVSAGDRQCMWQVAYLPDSWQSFLYSHRWVCAVVEGRLSTVFSCRHQLVR
jgi:hypothetical protein